jgi:type IX secretion system PorP/SprF family membrane protein
LNRLPEGTRLTEQIRVNSKFALLFILFTLTFPGFSQQNTLLTHSMFTIMSYNPGFAGLSEGISATGLVRQQWIGFKADDGTKSGPQTFFLTIDSPLKFLHGGVSGYIEQDKIAQFSTIKVKLGYSYLTEIGPGNFGAGLQVGFVNSKIDFSKFDPIDENDPVLEGESGKVDDFIVDLSLGAFYKVPDKYYVGLSADQILQTKGPQTSYQLRRQYYLTGGYYFPVPGHPVFELQPSTLMMYDGSVFQFQLALLAEYNKKIWGGLEYRFQDAVAILVGMNIKSVKVGLSYDIATSWMSSNSNGSLEIMLNYCFKIKTEKFRKSYKNTRFL